MSKPIFCIGGANIDRKLIACDQLLLGTSNPVSSTTTFGGVARNVAENLAHWTAPIHLQCVVGDDIEGKNLLAYMQQLGVDIRHCLILPHHSTSHYYAVLEMQGELRIALADMAIYNHIPTKIFKQAWNEWPDESIIFIDTNLPADILQQIIQHNKQNKYQLCIDPVAVLKAKRLPLSLENIFLIKPNQDEASALCNIPIHSINDCMTAGEILLKRGVKNVVISVGEAGYVIVNEEMKRHITITKIEEIKDVNGAGDAFVAGILYGLQQALPLLEACELGATAAALTIQSYKTVAENITARDLKSSYQHKNTKEPENAVIV